MLEINFRCMFHFYNLFWCMLHWSRICVLDMKCVVNVYWIRSVVNVYWGMKCVNVY